MTRGNRRTAVGGLALASIVGLLLGIRGWRPGAADPPPPMPATLLEGAVLESVLPGGQSRRFPLPLAAGRFARLEVMQHGVDAVLRLSAPGGATIVESDGVNGRQGPESVSLVTDRDGVYTLEVRAGASEPPHGRFTVRLAEEAPASARHRLRVAADGRAIEGRRLFLLGSPESLERAVGELGAAARDFERAGDAGGEADSRFVLGATRNRMERFGQALQPLTEALALARALGDPRREADALWLRGWSHWRLGEWQQALDDLGAALPLFREIGDSAREVRTLDRLTAIYIEAGDRRRALEYATASLRVARTLDESMDLGESLNIMGGLQLWLGSYEQALESLREAHAIGSRRGYLDVQSDSLNQQGVALRLLGRHREAREALARALDVTRRMGRSYEEAGIWLQVAGTYDRADAAIRRELLERSIGAARASGDRSTLASSLTLLAHEILRDGDLERARALVEEAVTVRETQWSRVPSGPLQAGYLADQFLTYEIYVDVLAAIHRSGADPSAGGLAFSSVDGARARALRQELVRARAEVEGGVPRHLLDRRRDLARELSAEETAARRRGPDEPRPAPDRIEVIEADLRRVERDIAGASPSWAGLMLSDPITVEEVQRDLLDADTVLLEYSLGRDRSHLFEVGASSLRLVELPPRTEIEAVARQVTEAIVARNRQVRFETYAERRERVAAADARFVEVARALSQMVLGPVADRLAGKRLALVTDGALQYVPFGALPEPRAASSGATAGSAAADPTVVPLARLHEIVHLPSAAALREIRRQSRGRQPQSEMLAVLADPVLHPDDPRIHRGRALGPMLGSLVGGPTLAHTRAAEDDEWPELPYAREEAEAILGLVPASDRLGALGFDASRATVESAELARYRIVHFATHVVLDTEEPDLSGIVLSRFDARGRPQEGLLSRFDVYALRLPADLVVLSGCRTALGKEVRGEGLVGLTRGFMYAGAPRVVVSLWDVQDRATAELMKRFYASLLRDGRRPAEALRQAQSEMASSAEWSAPYHWAGFVLQGDWR
jgi:CHAT domain-containing protein/tetratricopeptide (TPR) repeat protein